MVAQLHEFRVNGAQVVVEISPGDTLARVLREKLGLKGTKIACGRGECGACTVLADGLPVYSCVTLVSRVSEVETIESIAGRAEALRTNMALYGGYQCGFCTPGQVVSGTVVVNQAPGMVPEGDIRAGMDGNICRCTGYLGIVESVREAILTREVPE